MREVLRGLKACLVDPCPEVQLRACTLLATITSRCSPDTLCQLIEGDTCEYVYEVLRGLQQQQQQVGTVRGAAWPAAAAADGGGGAGNMWLEAVRGACVESLLHLSAQGMGGGGLQITE